MKNHEKGKITNKIASIEYGNDLQFIKSDIRELEFQSFDPFTHVFIFAFSYSPSALAKAFDLIHARYKNIVM
jgi:hypothetical protein